MEDSTQIRVTFRLTVRELYSVYFHTLLRLWLLIPIAICMFGILALSALSDFTGRTNYLRPAIIFVAVAAFVVCLVFVFPYFLARNALRSSALSKGDLHYMFTDTGAESTTPASQGRIEWHGFYRAVELNDFFLLYMSSRVFNVIPKRAFSGPDQIEAFRELLRSKIKGKVKLRPR